MRISVDTDSFDLRRVGTEVLVLARRALSLPAARPQPPRALARARP